MDLVQQVQVRGASAHFVGGITVTLKAKQLAKLRRREFWIQEKAQQITMME